MLSTLGSSAGGVGGGFFSLLYIAFYVLAFIGLWKMFVKAGHPGWGAIIPFYNLYLLLKVARRPGWWLILFFIPLVNIIIWLVVALDVSRNFGHGAGYGILLWIFPYIMFIVLGWGTDQYRGAQPAMAGGYGSATPPPPPPPLQGGAPPAPPWRRPRSQLR